VGPHPHSLTPRPLRAHTRLRAGVAAGARVAVAAGLTVYILYKSRPAQVLAALASADWRPMAIAVALTLVDRALMAYRWIVLLCTVDPASRPPLAEVLRIFFVSTFVGTFLPASVGGDAVRAYSIARLNVRGGDAVASVFMDRMLGVASILIMAILGLALARDLAGNVTVLTGLALCGAACVVTLLLVFSARAEAAAAALSERLPGAARTAARSLIDALRRYAGYHRQLGNVLAGSVGVQVLRIVQAYFLGVGLGMSVPISTYFAFIPLILLVMLLPVTFNGIGTSQVAFVWFFGRAGVADAPAFALSVLFVALGVVGNLPGGVLYAVGAGPKRLEQPRKHETTKI
jgi:glycosyltransferase 2 family protein